MSENNTDALRSWLIVLPIIFILFLAAVFLAFVNVEGLTTEQRLDYGTKAITTTGTIFAGIAVFINAFYAAKRAEAMDKSAIAANESAKAALKNAEAAIQNAKAAQDKQITERFAKAIEQLGSEKIEVRLGAIYTLERIAKDSPKDHWTIMEVLTAFVRENAPLKKEHEARISEPPKLSTDIQATLTVIGRRNCNNEPKNQRLNLSRVDIRRANLNEGKLQRIIFNGANLYKAMLIGADLEEAIFSETNLQETFLSLAKLQKATFLGANLQSTILVGANLQGAIFEEANLKGAILEKAILQTTNLRKAKNLEQWQIDSAKGDRTTILPDYLEYPEHWQ
ncbi:pentapeptide repeat-containing protein [Nostoc cycadae]|uniref:Pentapeptide repeat-containing protein n=1 Tax=Nostoc cycadae WK-1 TaxID=1861711 RepID=A0A2H6LEV2_9NOSO|nr:pentapeptide repeat-containing protein [Nostoc cycadae]GBE91751.1 pentapeptide repeat-containing protein [Nostoc cycadae WK-1]